MSLGLPQDCYGTPDIERFVKTLSGEHGTVVTAGTDASERHVTPGPDGRVNLTYVLSFDPQVMDGVAYGPNVGPRHFHVAGCQWLLRMGDPRQARPHVIELKDAPKAWRFYSTLGSDATRTEATASYEALSSFAMGGGAGGFEPFQVQGRPVSVFIDGAFDRPVDDIFAAIRRIVTAQRQTFGGAPPPFFHVVLRPRSGVIAGTAVDNAFICFAKKDISPRELHLILAHEMFHTWVPGQLDIALDPSEAQFRHQWFSEGFTEYLARQLLVVDGLMSMNDFAALVNSDLINLADNPHRDATHAAIVSVAKQGAFNAAAKKLAYYRGALIALEWDFQLKAKGNPQGLAALIKELAARVAGAGGTLSESAFFAHMAAQGIDARADFERHIVRGEPISLSPGVLGPGFTFRNVAVPAFDPGFDLELSLKESAIKGVLRTGPAFRAGLRNGMKLKSLRNSNRFANGWRADLPLEITVDNQDGPRQIKFFPRGASRQLRLLQALPPGQGASRVDTEKL
ncbi:hypothetical protein A176_002853 [Myxococcus hansupus]|uniref:Peptidase M61 catalytic domain-containing protein n=1 Tax=Pseudomyxococcus hansupus TaxID=1297742 RepID=A0A0H4WR10_9BACT|nr:hypothetical protein [Myxococcus hansupus]AKQ65941.1 hypothetical protein A176_002853 [Myxococcus hansupus]